MHILAIAAIAKICHQANKAYCESIGDFSQVDWEIAPQWQKDSAIKGVEFAEANRWGLVSAQHDSWLAQKEAEGWKYGPIKDAENKEHPCMVPYDQLPEAQRKKDELFKHIVEALL